MNSYLYDEDRWPSGSAGGFTAKENPENRRKLLCFTYTPYDDGTLITEADKEKSKKPNSEYAFLACFDVELDSQSKLVSYKRISLSENAAE